MIWSSILWINKFIMIINVYNKISHKSVRHLSLKKNIYRPIKYYWSIYNFFKNGKVDTAGGMPNFWNSGGIIHLIHPFYTKFTPFILYKILTISLYTNLLHSFYTKFNPFILYKILTISLYTNLLHLFYTKFNPFILYKI